MCPICFATTASLVIGAILSGGVPLFVLSKHAAAAAGVCAGSRNDNFAPEMNLVVGEPSRKESPSHV
jgi:hypothetical protein